MNGLMKQERKQLFGVPVAEVFKVNEGHPNQAEDNENKIQRSQLVHALGFLLQRNEINYSTETHQKQGQNDAAGQVKPGKRGFDDNPKNQYSETQFSGVIKKFRQVITSERYQVRRGQVL